jgi:hypothetical protein
MLLDQQKQVAKNLFRSENTRKVKKMSEVWQITERCDAYATNACAVHPTPCMHTLCTPTLCKPTTFTPAPYTPTPYTSILCTNTRGKKMSSYERYSTSLSPLTMTFCLRCWGVPNIVTLFV